MSFTAAKSSMTDRETKDRRNGENQTEDPKDAKRKGLRKIAEETLEAIEHGSYLKHDLKARLAVSKQNTRYYAPDSLLSTWTSASHPKHDRTQMSLYEISTLEGARLLSIGQTTSDPARPPSRIGILNFASAKKPGGGFLSGASAQEESIARSSTLYPSLMTRVAQEFYSLHNHDAKGGYYSHAMVYSPHVVVLRDDHGAWVAPLAVDVLTSAAVNAGVVRQTVRARVAGAAEEERIARAMRERMARVLFLFESQGVRDIVLGSFGTGVFRNKVATVAGIWAELLLEDGARFRHSFEHVVFAVLGRETFDEFKQVFAPHGL